jgi:hypothetical protein
MPSAGRAHERHRGKGHSAAEVLPFFKLIDLHVPRDLEISGDPSVRVAERRGRLLPESL